MSLDKLIRDDSPPPVPNKEDIYISFAELRDMKQDWLSEKLHEGYKIFIVLKKGPPIKLSFVEYK